MSKHNCNSAGIVIVAIVPSQEDFLCINEVCDHRQIPSERTRVYIDPKNRDEIIRAHCDQCRMFYTVTRGMRDGKPFIKTVTAMREGPQVEKFLKEIQSVGEIQMA